MVNLLLGYVVVDKVKKRTVFVGQPLAMPRSGKNLPAEQGWVSKNRPHRENFVVRFLAISRNIPELSSSKSATGLGT